MTYLEDALRHSDTDARLPPVPLNWSAAKIDDLDRLANGIIQPLAAVDAVLAPLLLMCAKGDFEGAEKGMISLLRDHGDVRRCDDQTYISLLNGAFTLQRLDLVAAMLRDWHGFNGEFELARAEEGIGAGQVRWEIGSSGKHRFT